MYRKTVATDKFCHNSQHGLDAELPCSIFYLNLTLTEFLTIIYIIIVKKLLSL